MTYGLHTTTRGRPERHDAAMQYLPLHVPLAIDILVAEPPSMLANEPHLAVV